MEETSLNLLEATMLMESVRLATLGSADLLFENHARHTMATKAETKPNLLDKLAECLIKALCKLLFPETTWELKRPESTSDSMSNNHVPESPSLRSGCRIGVKYVANKNYF